MNKVISINLGGNAYQVEEPGYDKLKAYLDSALEKLADDPDKEEIRQDLERSIADKATRFVRPHKNVITTLEVVTILEEMGPVHASASHSTEGNQEDKKEKAAAPKKLYQIREGAVVSGVCMGLAAYFGVDVTLVRILFVILTILTHGAWILVYIVMMAVVPYAETSRDYAAAKGVPYTAQEWINAAKAEYHKFKSKEDWQYWKHNVHQNMRTEKQRMKRNFDQSKQYWHENQHPVWGVVHGLLGLVWTVLIAFAIWYGYGHSPAFHHVMDQIPVFLKQVWVDAKTTFTS